MLSLGEGPTKPRHLRLTPRQSIYPAEQIEQKSITEFPINTDIFQLRLSHCGLYTTVALT